MQDMASNRRQYRLTPKALADLEDIWSYTCQQWSSEQAEKYHNDIIKAIEALSQGAVVWQKADHVRPGYLKYRVASHILFFTISDDFLDVIRILHMRMDVPHHFADSDQTA